MKYKSFIFGIGIRYFSLQNFNYNNSNTKEIDNSYKSIGPLSQISLNMNDSLQLSFYGWYEFITIDDFSKKELANLNLQFNWKL